MAQQSGVRHIVKLSQLHADANSPERFLRYHGSVQAVVKASGLSFTFLCPNLYMQGLFNFRQSIQQKSAFFAAASDARISAVDVHLTSSRVTTPRCSLEFSHSPNATMQQERCVTANAAVTVIEPRIGLLGRDFSNP